MLPNSHQTLHQAKVFKRLTVALLLTSILVLAPRRVRGGYACFDFNTDPAVFWDAVGSPGAIVPSWQPSGGLTNSGCFVLTDGPNQTSAFLFPDFQNGQPIAGFDLQCYIALGDWTGDSPDNGFSVNYVNADDPIVALIESGYDPGRGLNQDGQWAGSADNGGTDSDLPEEGAKSGVAIGFDTHSGDGPFDIRGISVRIDGQQLAQIPIPAVSKSDNTDLYPTAAEYLADPATLITGPHDPVRPGSGARLGWAPLRITMDANGTLNLYWKGSHIIPNLETAFRPGFGRLLFGGSSGPSAEFFGIDGLCITSDSNVATLGKATGSPVGFIVTAKNSGSSVLDPQTLILKLDDLVVPVTSAVVDSNNTWTITTSNPQRPLAPLSTHTASISAKDTRGIVLLPDQSIFTVPDYTTIAAGTAAAGVDTNAPGFTLRVAQAEFNADLPTPRRRADVGPGTSIAFGERVLHGDFGLNTADLRRYPAGVFHETNVINNSALPGNYGEFADDGSVANGLPAPNLPGLPGKAKRESGNVDGAVSIVTYIEFPKPGAYRLTFSCNAAFRTMTSANPLEQLNSQILSVGCD